MKQKAVRYNNIICACQVKLPNILLCTNLGSSTGPIFWRVLATLNRTLATLSSAMVRTVGNINLAVISEPQASARTCNTKWNYPGKKKGYMKLNRNIFHNNVVCKLRHSCHSLTTYGWFKLKLNHVWGPFEKFMDSITQIQNFVEVWWVSFLASELPFHGWKSPEIAWDKIWIVWQMF
jgi:hypothetical protein